MFQRGSPVDDVLNRTEATKAESPIWEALKMNFIGGRFFILYNLGIRTEVEAISIVSAGERREDARMLTMIPPVSFMELPEKSAMAIVMISNIIPEKSNVKKILGDFTPLNEKIKRKR